MLSIDCNRGKFNPEPYQSKRGGRTVRRILSDSQWARVAPLLPGKDGYPGRSARDNREFLEAVPQSSRGQACGLLAPARHGAICQRSSGCGTRCSNASEGGHSTASSSASSRSCRPMPTSSTCSSTAPSYGFTNTVPGQKGDPKPSRRSLARGAKHEDQRNGRCP